MQGKGAGVYDAGFLRDAARMADSQISTRRTQNQMRVNSPSNTHQVRAALDHPNTAARTHSRTQLGARASALHRVLLERQSQIQCMVANAPTRSDVQARLRAVEAEIIAFGVKRLALFGSVRRDTAHPDSDVDLLVEFEPDQKTLAHLVDLGDLLEAVLGRRVELVTHEGLSPFLRPHILADAVDVVRAA